MLKYYTITVFKMSPKDEVNIILLSQLIYTFTDSKDSNCFILFFELKKPNIFYASVSLAVNVTCYFFLEQGIISEMLKCLIY